MTDRTADHPSSLVELTRTRIKMFMREPSAVFWTFGFPILLSVALGIAFRNKPPEAPRVVIERVGDADAVQDALTKDGAVRATIADAASARQALRTGKVALVVVPASSGSQRTYLFDDTRPESRIARLMVDDRLQRAEGRADASATPAPRWWSSPPTARRSTRRPWRGSPAPAGCGGPRAASRSPSTGCT